MIVEKLADELKTEFTRKSYAAPDRTAWLAVARRVKELLGADKPVATREAVDEWIRAKCPIGSLASQILAALAHFAPPRQRMAIEGMDVMAIGRAMVESTGPLLTNGEVIALNCAVVAHRLANTPAPEVDPDAGAKRLAYEEYSAGWDDDQGKADSDMYWNSMMEGRRNWWRKRAVMEKGNE